MQYTYFQAEKDTHTISSRLAFLRSGVKFTSAHFLQFQRKKMRSKLGLRSGVGFFTFLYCVLCTVVVSHRFERHLKIFMNAQVALGDRAKEECSTYMIFRLILPYSHVAVVFSWSHFQTRWVAWVLAANINFDRNVHFTLERYALSITAT